MSLGSLEEGKLKRTGNNRTRRKKEGNRAFLSSSRPTRVNSLKVSFKILSMHEIPVGTSAKESVLVAYVSIGNESRRLQNSQLNGMGNNNNHHHHHYFLR